jgi:hypothetical protein
MWGEQKALEMIAAAGFTDVRVETVDGDVVNNTTSPPVADRRWSHQGIGCADVAFCVPEWA